MEEDLEKFKTKMRARFELKLQELGNRRLLRLEEMEDAVEKVEREMSQELLEGLIDLKKTVKAKTIPSPVRNAGLH